MGVSLFVGLLGALVGGIFALYGAIVSGNINRLNQNLTGVDRKINVLKGIKCEIDTVWGIYNQGMGSKLTEHNGTDFFNYTFSATQDNFSFYHNSVADITALDKTTCKSIIEAYSYAKSLLDTFKLHADMLSSFEEYVKKKTEYKDRRYDIFITDIRSKLCEYSQSLKAAHEQTKLAIDSTLQEIDKSVDRLTQQRESLDKSGWRRLFALLCLKNS
ncbi:hypothetical protein [Budvicia diplopodorum]|uniref:hypothetical protein n=1 Tax=Budvicia diplopodorum TaxID=1119056 RepID=UPI00135AF0F0|nr:hypothetical protein [Budvicia diplopodorum]